MVLRFFKSGENALEHIEHEVLAMIGSCRHSFDLAMSALVSDADITPIGEEVRATDRGIKQHFNCTRIGIVLQRPHPERNFGKCASRDFVQGREGRRCFRA
jgi:hypothetical protein